MAYRLYTLLPLLLATIAKAAETPSASDMSDAMENMNMESALSIAVPAAAPAPTSPPFAANQSVPAAPKAPGVISHAQANAVIQAAVAKANDITQPSNIAVTDPSGHLVAFLRMDGAVLVSIEVAQKKARTVSMFGGKYRTGDLYNATSPGGALYGIQSTNNGLIFFGGGVPLKLNGSFVGALGVSGGTVDQDTTIANAAASSLR